MKQDWTGTSGEVGSKQCWDSESDEVGAGCQEIKTVEENKHLETILTFTRPQPSEGGATVDLVAKDGGTEVTWGMTGPMPYPMNIITLMMNMEEMMGEDWTAGLNKLKELSEAAANAPKLLETAEEGAEDGDAGDSEAEATE